jgi:hypothetical protein
LDLNFGEGNLGGHAFFGSVQEHLDQAAVVGFAWNQGWAGFAPFQGSLQAIEAEAGHLLVGAVALLALLNEEGAEFPLKTVIRGAGKARNW